MKIQNRYTDKIILDTETETLSCANLSGANLSGADLYGANLIGADLSGADLRVANLRVANLRVANLRVANLDMSCWPLSCGSFDVKVDDKLCSQLFYHWARLDVSGCSPYVRYLHRIIVGANKYLANIFATERNTVSEIR